MCVSCSQHRLFLSTTLRWLLSVFKITPTIRSPRYMVPKRRFRLIPVFTKISLLSCCFYRALPKVWKQTSTWSTGMGSVQSATRWSEQNDLKMAVLSHKKSPWRLLLVAQFTYKGWIISNKKKLWSYFNDIKNRNEKYACSLKSMIISNCKHF